MSRQMEIWARLLVLSFGMAALLGCDPIGGGDDDDDDFTPSGDCPDEDLYYAEVCDETYCGEPQVRIGTGATAYEPLEDGADPGIWFGTQGGYHIFIAIEMDKLCPVVRVTPSITVNTGTDEVVIYEELRNIQAVRVEPGESPLQHIWAIRGFIPCTWWPNDPNNDPFCEGGSGSDGRIDEFPGVINVTVEDRNERSASASLDINPTCCVTE